MSHPVFIHVQSTGDVYFSQDVNFTPAGTSLAVFRVNSSAASQKIGTLSGNSGTYAVSGSVGKFGKETI